ncbi:putative Gcp-like domain-containing protein [Rosa chinensis]|uniref:Putative Gcp-like domain-containing protein n=1 Tax=Rosa chinensis TaxID=74649 RepID=A0A2P6SFY0_ROSCH|nr:putative Gcp-like domain-containing protein [Rosa chinensis]
MPVAVVSGGVASNQYVRARLDQVVKKNNLQLVCLPPSLCTDNGNSFYLVLAQLVVLVM